MKIKNPLKVNPCTMFLSGVQFNSLSFPLESLVTKFTPLLDFTIILNKDNCTQHLGTLF